MPTTEHGKPVPKWVLPAVAVIIIILDQITKAWIRSFMEPGDSIPIWASFSLTYVQNTGSAFGLFAGRGIFLSVFGLIAVVLVLIFYRRLGHLNRVALAALSLIIGGALGNMVDRFALGYVTDFVDVRLWSDFHWPFFNVADSAITIGGLMLIYYLLGLLRREDADGVRREA